jgi:transcriptional regulator with XRE-family HTH domain
MHDPEWFRRDGLPRLASVKLSEIAEAAGCSKAYASDYRRGKRTPHVSTWAALGRLVSLEIFDSAKPSADIYCMDGHR